MPMPRCSPGRSSLCDNSSAFCFSSRFSRAVDNLISTCIQSSFEIIQVTQSAAWRRDVQSSWYSRLDTTDARSMHRRLHSSPAPRVTAVSLWHFPSSARSVSVPVSLSQQLPVTTRLGFVLLFLFRSICDSGATQRCDAYCLCLFIKITHKVVDRIERNFLGQLHRPRDCHKSNFKHLTHTGMFAWVTFCIPIYADTLFVVQILKSGAISLHGKE